MAYFDDIKVGDRVWDFEHRYGKVVDIKDNKKIKVKFDNRFTNEYDFDGKNIYYNPKYVNQRLFLDEINFELPQKPKVELRENKYLICLNDNIIDDDKEFIDARISDYTIENGLTRDDADIATKALKQITKYTKLLALRDQECKDSRGFIPSINKKYYIIYKEKDGVKNEYVADWNKGVISQEVPFATKKDAEHICFLLNNKQFKL